MESCGHRLLRTMQQMSDSLACEPAKQVVIACRTTPVPGFFGLVLVFRTQVGIAAQQIAHVRRGEQVKLDARAFGAGRIQRNQHFDHALVRAGLRHDHACPMVRPCD